MVVSASWVPWLAVAGVIAWNLVELVALTRPVSYADDSSIHEQMVRFATLQFRTGHLPLTAWFPYLGLGSPQFLHYQSLPAMLAGLAGLLIGPNAAFRWSLYLLVCLWPLSVYGGARILGLERWVAAAAAAMSPFLMSVPGVGYERTAYVWIGYGVWTQLWASVTLPFAWAFSWRAIRDARSIAPAVVLVSLTTALHFETGYLAVMPLVLWPLLSGRPIMARLRRAAVVLAGVLLLSAWVVVPVIANRNWAATNEVLQGGPLVNGYGAPKILGWLVTGKLLDAGRLPVITLFAAIGLALMCYRWRTERSGRAVVIAFAGSLLLSFGRTTFGPLVDIIPGHGDIFFRRFAMGAQLAGLWLAGVGLVWCLRMIAGAVDRRAVGRGARSPLRARRVRDALACAAGVAVLIPALLQVSGYDSRNDSAVRAQRDAELVQGVQVDRLVAIVKRDGGGRVYAGLPSNWGARFTVGGVPVLKYLESRDVDEVGYTLRTASLMTDPEFYFDEFNPGDYSLFGIHYLILPFGRAPAVRAQQVTCAGAYCLWSIGARGLVHVGSIVGTLAADRTNVGIRSIPLLRSGLPDNGQYLSVAYGRRQAARVSPSAPPGAGPVGSVSSERDNLVHGQVAVTVHARIGAVAVLSSSFDPGWRATVDGRLRPVQIVAPALVATSVPAGTHRIVFRYHGYSGYPAVFTVSALALAALIAVEWLRRRRPGLSWRDG